MTGEMAEWSIAAVLKTVEPKGSGGSNPSLSAIIDEYLQRRVNVIKAYIGMFNIALSKDCDVLEIHPEITPYMLDNEIEEINMWLAANGNKPLVSQKQSVKSANLSQDPEAEKVFISGVQ